MVSVTWYIQAFKLQIDTSPTAWRTIKPAIEAKLILARDQKARIARKAVIDSRVTVIRKAYVEYLETLQPKLWQQYPSSSGLFDCGVFDALINDPSDSELTIADCGNTLLQLNTYLADHRERQLRRSAGLFFSSDVTCANNIEVALSKFALATSVFSCEGCTKKFKDERMCLMGWNQVSMHVSDPEKATAAEGTVVFSKLGSQVASSLVELLSLDPLSASADDADQQNARFLCASCPIQRFQSASSGKALTWRESVCSTLISFFSVGLMAEA